MGKVLNIYVIFNIFLFYMIYLIGLNRELNVYKRFFNILNSVRVKICETFINLFLGFFNIFRWVIFSFAKCWVIVSLFR